MESRSPCGCATATGPDERMQPGKASAVMMAMIGNRNARATRTGAIPHSETALVLHRLWLTNRFSMGCVDEVRTFCARDVATVRSRTRSTYPPLEGPGGGG